MCNEDIFRVLDLILSFVGLILAWFGFIVPYVQSKKAEEKRREDEIKAQQTQWEKEWIDMQISNLYGPLNELTKEQSVRWKLILWQLGRNSVFKKNQSKLSDLPQYEQKIWMHFVDNYILPTNKRIVEIIEGNQHLIYNSIIPPSFNTYLEYALGWEMLDNQKKKRSF